MKARHVTYSIILVLQVLIITVIIDYHFRRAAHTPLCPHFSYHVSNTRPPSRPPAAVAINIDSNRQHGFYDQQRYDAQAPAEAAWRYDHVQNLQRWPSYESAPTDQREKTGEGKRRASSKIEQEVQKGAEEESGVSRETESADDREGKGGLHEVVLHGEVRNVGQVEGREEWRGGENYDRLLSVSHGQNQREGGHSEESGRLLSASQREIDEEGQFQDQREGRGGDRSRLLSKTFFERRSEKIVVSDYDQKFVKVVTIKTFSKKFVELDPGSRPLKTDAPPKGVVNLDAGSSEDQPTIDTFSKGFVELDPGSSGEQKEEVMTSDTLSQEIVEPNPRSSGKSVEHGFLRTLLRSLMEKMSFSRSQDEFISRGSTKQNVDSEPTNLPRSDTRRNLDLSFDQSRRHKREAKKRRRRSTSKFTGSVIGASSDKNLLESVRRLQKQIFKDILRLQSEATTGYKRTNSLERFVSLLGLFPADVRTNYHGIEKERDMRTEHSIPDVTVLPTVLILQSLVEAKLFGDVELESSDSLIKAVSAVDAFHSHSQKKGNSILAMWPEKLIKNSPDWTVYPENLVRARVANVSRLGNLTSLVKECSDCVTSKDGLKQIQDTNLCTSHYRTTLSAAMLDVATPPDLMTSLSNLALGALLRTAKNTGNDPVFKSEIEMWQHNNDDLDFLVNKLKEMVIVFDRPGYSTGPTPTSDSPSPTTTTTTTTATATTTTTIASTTTAGTPDNDNNRSIRGTSLQPKSEMGENHPNNKNQPTDTIDNDNDNTNEDNSSNNKSIRGNVPQRKSEEKNHPENGNHTANISNSETPGSDHPLVTSIFSDSDPPSLDYVNLTKFAEVYTSVYGQDRPTSWSDTHSDLFPEGANFGETRDNDVILKEETTVNENRDNDVILEEETSVNENRDNDGPELSVNERESIFRVFDNDTGIDPDDSNTDLDTRSPATPPPSTTPVPQPNTSLSLGVPEEITTENPLPSEDSPPSKESPTTAAPLQTTGTAIPSTEIPPPDATAHCNQVVDSVSYFAMRNFLQETLESSANKSAHLIPLWFSDSCTQPNNSYHENDDGSTGSAANSCDLVHNERPYHRYNVVDLTTAATALHALVTAQLSGLVDIEGDAQLQTIITSTVDLLTWFVNHPDDLGTSVVLSPFPSRFQLYWLMSRVSFRVSDPTKVKAGVFKFAQTSMDKFTASLRQNLTLSILKSIVDDGLGTDGRTRVHVDDILGIADLDKDGKAKSTGDDRLFSSAMAANTLISIWTTQQTNGNLRFIPGTRDAVKIAVNSLLNFVFTGVTDKELRQDNAFMAEVVKDCESLGAWYPYNTRTDRLGQLADTSEPKVTDRFGVSGYVAKKDYEKLLESPKFPHQTIPSKASDYLTGSDSLFRFWSSSAYTNAAVLLAISQGANVVTN